MAAVGARQTIPIIDLAAEYAALKPEIDAAIQRVLDSAHFILGPEVEALEREVAAYCGVAHAVAVASGTDALELSLRACGVGPGDEVITPGLSFFASAGAAASLGAVPVFVDIDPATYTIDPLRIEQAITPKTRAIIPVHLYGHPCPMEEIMALARRRGLRVIEDCAQAFGAASGSRRVGSFGDAGAFSFYPTKNLGAYGDGGMVVMDDASLADQIRLLRSHGSRDRVRHEVVSRNSRLDDLQAAILRVKLTRIEAWNNARRERATTYTRLLLAAGLPGLVTPIERPGAHHVYHLYTIQVPRRAALQKALADRGISTQAHYQVPLHLEPAFASLGYRKGGLPVAEQAAETVLTLPIFPSLTSEQQQYVVHHLTELFGAS